ncbi:MAG: FAD-binding protein [Proteobacteria bacterium]|nr:FAD-binding protein [Pseudomonadota bacterium]
MPQSLWTARHITHCEQQIGLRILSDEHSLASFSGDFGGLAHSKPAAVFSPPTTRALQQLIAYADENGLPVTVRANGLSQSGQSLPVAGGLTLRMNLFDAVHEQEDAFIWVDANASWSALLAATLKESRVPYVTPYNLNLSIAGLLSVGGVGAASFKHGIAASHVNALEVVTANGEIQRVDATSLLFHACLGGQGQFGVITKVAVQLRPCSRQVRTFFLTYSDREQWLKDLAAFKRHADFIEAFCSPALQGAKLTAKGRQPFAEWLFSLQVSFEYDSEPPELTDFGSDIKPWKVPHRQDETMESYLFRHEPRIQAMKASGQWELQHPWYECLVTHDVVVSELDDLLRSLPLYFATMVHLVPISGRQPTGFLIAPSQAEFFSVMILNPGVPRALVPGCLESIREMDERLLAKGGKRYLSGFLGPDLSADYWMAHFGSDYTKWSTLKSRYDPKGIFCSTSCNHKTTGE